MIDTDYRKAKKKKKTKNENKKKKKKLKQNQNKTKQNKKKINIWMQLPSNEDPRGFDEMGLIQYENFLQTIESLQVSSSAWTSITAIVI